MGVIDFGVSPASLAAESRSCSSIPIITVRADGDTSVVLVSDRFRESRVGFRMWEVGFDSDWPAGLGYVLSPTLALPLVLV